ncbi:Phenylacetyl-CoA ligase [Mycena indigotica]|uniref:Phenylacetyl-CoA ligase n=1 Tax=Mycena indigotica TaxID=2126181 RepID=A0A8H6SWF5_9AGAR|nr:Phenylacetyl-CoA ligase [Mycena indigotica]KAF7307183.1 Phenylacetyl-CoA ligase [Mycena indigotica]
MATTFTPPPDALPLPEIPDNLTIPQFIFDTAQPTRPARPDSVPWLIEDHSGKRIGLDELRLRTTGLANALSLKWGIREDSVVCLFSPNHVDYPVCVWAAHTLGAIVTPANPSYTAPELLYQLATVKASILLVASESLSTALSAARQAGLSEDRIIVIEPSCGSRFHGRHETLSNLIDFGNEKPLNFIERRLNPGEAKTKIAFYSFSSGTTGTPKAVVIPHYSVITNIIQKAAHYRITDPAFREERHMNPGDVALAVLPFFHIYGLVVVLHYMIFSGCSLVVIPKFNFTEFLESVVKHKITRLFVVPPQIVLMCKHPATKNYDLTHVKLIVSGAAPMSGKLMQSLSKVCPNAVIGQGYGMTETCTTVCQISASQRMGAVGSAGQLVPGITARVVREDGTLCKEGERGELMITGPSIPLGYLNNPKATQETFVDGWVRTGDEVVIKDYEIYIVDRIKELIKVKGNQVSPADLEGHLLLHPAVADCCVVSLLDEYNGEAPMAYVVLREDAKRRLAGNQQAEETLQNVLKKHVADHKIAYKHLTGGVVFVDAIPKNPSGKILRRVLRDEARRKYTVKSRL